MNPEVGKYLNEFFVASFQKVGTFHIVGNQKQGGNVAAYFCAPDGRVLHCVAGAVDAATLLREARWVVETTKTCLAESKGDGGRFKVALRRAHAEKLRNEHGLNVEPVVFDPVVEMDPNSALTYRDPTGRPLAPRLPPPPVEGPDVRLMDPTNVAMRSKQSAEAAAPGARDLVDRGGRRQVLGNQGRVHLLMAGHAMVKLENVYGSVFQGILGEQISTRPVEVVTPFPWRPERARNLPAVPLERLEGPG